MRPEISVVLPAYRTSRFVEPMVERVARALAGRSYEIVFVDDACPEDSWARIEDASRRDAHVRGIALARNVGQHAAVLAGIRYAAGGVVVVMDADLQDPPEAIPALVHGARDRGGAVFGGRRGRYESRGRLATSRVFKALLALACRVPRDAGMFVALSREAAERLCSMPPGPSVVAMIGRACSSVSIPIERGARSEGGSAYSSRMRARMGLRALVWSMTAGRLGAATPQPVVRASCGRVLDREMGA